VGQQGLGGGVHTRSCVVKMQSNTFGAEAVLLYTNWTCSLASTALAGAWYVMGFQRTLLLKPVTPLHSCCCCCR
jgi:hypothetical protein